MRDENRLPSQPRASRRRRLVDLPGAQRGSAAVELAAVMPFLMMLLAGAVEFNRGFTLQVDLEQAAQRAAELAAIRKPTANTTTALAHIKNEAVTASGQPEGNVTVELYRHCNDSKTEPYGTACSGGQVSADYVSVEISGTYTRLIDWKKFAGMTSGATSTVKGQATVRMN